MDGHFPVAVWIVPPFQLALCTRYILASAVWEGEVLGRVAGTSGKGLMTFPSPAFCEEPTSLPWESPVGCFSCSHGDDRKAMAAMLRGQRSTRGKISNSTDRWSSTHSAPGSSMRAPSFFTSMLSPASGRSFGLVLVVSCGWDGKSEGCRASQHAQGKRQRTQIQMQRLKMPLRQEAVIMGGGGYRQSLHSVDVASPHCWPSDRRVMSEMNWSFFAGTCLYGGDSSRVL